MNTILIIDDEEKLRSLLSRIISLEGFDVLEAGTAKLALKKLETLSVDVVLCDVKLPDTNGVELLGQIKEKYPFIEVILLTAYGNIPDGVQAMKKGAFDYITKADDNDKIIPLLYKALEKVALSKRLFQLEKRLENKYSFASILGKSASIQEAIRAAERVSVTDATVLLHGETGTGKEVFAQAIHHNSGRSKKTFIAINCAAFSKELLENELFGHKAGAFTGAIKDSKGIFEEANGGTVFLDEIGEMPIDLQAKLLRVLESGQFLKVGDSKPTTVNLRIIAATNRNLQLEIQQGHFREDLYYRISVFQIHLPPLRERTQDINELAQFFCLHFAEKLNKKQVQLSPEYLKALKAHPWKGNIRELKNVIERSLIISDGNLLLPVTLPSDFQMEGFADENDTLELAAMEKKHIQKVLKYTNGNKTESAKLLNIALTTLYRKIDEYKLH
ncbi:sigma-54-dependent transcriptional regulator [Sediminibacterium salmoneum]|uniref:sigma-54-dependent transcriptional regulator n=1 Tax=Sediminibacterium salmoneum TaxID=426421 RepID=UPI00047DB2B2|nr:sigma-54 dependent transcriptional regulator [Sediminibacterium salmoneum]